MGIPTYFRVICQQYKDIIHYTKPCICDHYFVDFNGLIHPAAHRVIAAHISTNDEQTAQLEQSIICESYNYLQKCIQIADPQHMIHTCADGVAPIANMKQQRKRRYMSVLRNKLCNSPAVWDTNAISPGTNFMTKLDTFMKKQIREHSTLSHYYSGSDEVGEGEHKLFARMGMLVHEETAFINGLDADLIMLSLISHRHNIYLMREHDGANDEDGADNKYMYLNVNALRQALLTELSSVYQWPCKECIDSPFIPKSNDVIESYVVLCFILGNDFLPHASTLSLKKHGYEKLLRASQHVYKDNEHGINAGNTLVMDGKIQMSFLTSLFRILAKDEDSIMNTINTDYMNKKAYFNKDHSDPEVIQCYALQAQHKSRLAFTMYNSPSSIWRGLYYKSLFHCRMHDTKTISSTCDLFIKGIFWTYAYYKRQPKNNNWFYPYNYAPTLLDISNWVSTNPNIVKECVAINNADGAHVVTPYTQLLSILPPESHALLPRKYHAYMFDPKYGMAHMFPTKYPIETYLKTHLWECSPILPVLDIQHILKSMNC